MASGSIFGDVEVLEYLSSKIVIIRFISTNTYQVSNSTSIRRHSVKNLFKRTLYSVGFLGVGKYKSTDEAYNRWKAILCRCYCKKSLERNPTYVGCTVDPVWHNYQNFAKWYHDNEVVGYHIDKDLKIRGNKVYSPETCTFVPPEDNVPQLITRQ